MDLHILIVDDEALARARMRTLLGDCDPSLLQHVHEAADAPTAMAVLDRERVDVVLLDIHMPGTNGLGLANHLRTLLRPPAVVFVTAHDDRAVAALSLYIEAKLRAEAIRHGGD